MTGKNTLSRIGLCYFIDKNHICLNLSNGIMREKKNVMHVSRMYRHFVKGKLVN